jgi:general L-amino acid transport system permease protein
MSRDHAQTGLRPPQMLPEQDPPSAETGAVKWLRENLFSSWLNAILTTSHLRRLLGRGACAALGRLRHLGRRFAQRMPRDPQDDAGPGTSAPAGPSSRSAGQLLFGFYPPSAYWRPIPPSSCSAGRRAGAVPAFRSGFSTSGRRRRSCAYWLIWGGSIWGRSRSRRASAWARLPIRAALSRGGQRLLAGDRRGHRPAARLLEPVSRRPLRSRPRGHPPLPLGLPRIASKDFGGFMLT